LYHLTPVKRTISTNFCNLKILRLGHHQFQESGLAKMARISGFGILGLQPLVNS